MASDSVKKILAAEAAAEKKNIAARARCEEIVGNAQRNSDVAVQKKITEATIEADSIKRQNLKRLDDYRRQAEEKYSKQKDSVQKKAEKNMPEAIDSIINAFFS